VRVSATKKRGGGNAFSRARVNRQAAGAAVRGKPGADGQVGAVIAACPNGRVPRASRISPARGGTPCRQTAHGTLCREAESV